jgi:hypothetical protein
MWEQGFKKRPGTRIAAVTKQYRQPTWSFLDLLMLRMKITKKSSYSCYGTPLLPWNSVTDLKIQKFKQEKKESNLKLKKKKSTRLHSLHLQNRRIWILSLSNQHLFCTKSQAFESYPNPHSLSIQPFSNIITYFSSLVLLFWWWQTNMLLHCFL